MDPKGVRALGESMGSPYKTKKRGYVEGKILYGYKMRKRGSSLGGWGPQNLNPNPSGKISNFTSAYFQMA